MDGNLRSLHRMGEPARRDNWKPLTLYPSPLRKGKREMETGARCSQGSDARPLSVATLGYFLATPDGVLQAAPDRSGAELFSGDPDRGHRLPARARSGAADIDNIIARTTIGHAAGVAQW